MLEHYLGAIAEISGRGLDTEVSVKLTQLGLEFGEQEARDRFSKLAAATTSIPLTTRPKTVCSVSFFR